jgi:hypothetical protein
MSHPFRLNNDGSVVTVDQNSDISRAELIAAMVNTRTGERPLVPNFGMNDPAFAGLDPSALQAQIDIFGPAAVITRAEAVFVSDSEQDVTVEFD